MKNDNAHTAETVRPPAPYPGNRPGMRPEVPNMVFGEVEFEAPEPDLAEQSAAELKCLEQRK
jgi:hypothetical protein